MIVKKYYGVHALRLAVGMIVLGLLLAGSANAASLTVCPSGCEYSSIQKAINASSNGDTILVNSGTYLENVNVNKKLTLRGIGMPVVDANGSGSAITLAGDGIILEGFTATGSAYDVEAGIKEAGIKLISSTNSLIGNNASSNYHGILLDSFSNNNTLNSNNANSNNRYCISLYYSSNNTINGNNASNGCEDGIYMDSSSNNTLSSNNVSNNGDDGIYIVSSNNNTLSGNNALNNYYGIFLSHSSNNKLSGNNASNNHNDGIGLVGCNNNTLSSNNANTNNNGIYLSGNNNILIGNNASNNANGIRIGYSSNNTLISNNASNNHQGEAGSQFGYGISLWSSSNNTLSSNNASNNSYGIYIDSSSNNKIYNNFFNNINNFLFYGSNVNNWNTTKQSGTNIVGGLYLGGNYWAYPNGTGVSQTCSDANKDGICDSIYELDASNKDFLPLKKQLTGTISGTVRRW